MSMLVLALCVSLSLNIVGFRNSIVAESIADDSRAIVVLRFSNTSNDPENAFFGDGIHDDLPTKLASIKALCVMSLTSSLAYKDSTKNIREISRELGSNYS